MRYGNVEWLLSVERPTSLPSTLLSTNDSGNCHFSHTLRCLKLLEEMFRLLIRKNFFTERVVKQAAKGNSGVLMPGSI